MTSKRLIARTTAVVLALFFIVAVSAGAYYDAGGWPAVAVVWAMGAVLLAAVRAFVWAFDNWNAQ
ncbi:hypothetical protein GLX30_30275 [Streptomyces sp. Tu 2975]|uniref:hypothetical protein n=1 Tax=Streptomyces sp. Tu 2975 TaxID=2676871 RepID=UPI001358AC3B|nr:hypothetical protein [Streptomyces sp. Tu 2975]QIP87602.1 hypothetical protein GLX30_30275 [Streptomyces sp. Tu 2975]